MTLFQTTKDAELFEQSEGWPKARPTSTSPRTPSGSRPGTGRAENLARWSILALQSTEYPHWSLHQFIDCTSGPSWQSCCQSHYKEAARGGCIFGWNLGFHICKDQVWFVAHCQGVEQEVSLVPPDSTSGPRWLRSGN